VRENIEIVLIIKPEADSTELAAFVQQLQSKEQIKSCKWVSREEAAEMLKNELGEDFIQFLGYNPLYPSIDIRFKAGFSDEISIGNFLAGYKRHPLVHQIDYQPSLVESINRNLRTITWILLAFSVLLIIVSVTLINNTIRISLYARRLLIKSMLLVGATKGFILKPFLITSIWNGILGALISLLLIGALSYFAAIKIPELAMIQDIELILVVAVTLFLCGIFLSLTCTWFAVNRYLRYRTENLV
jgi:cell division transport system permease protein